MNLDQLKQRVLAAYPLQHVYCAGQFDPDRPPHSITGFAIISALDPRNHLGYGKSEYDAWSDAASRLNVDPNKKRRNICASFK